MLSQESPHKGVNREERERINKRMVDLVTYMSIYSLQLKRRQELIT